MNAARVTGWLQYGDKEIPGEANKSVGAYDELKHKLAPSSGRISTPSDFLVVGKVPAGFPQYK